MDCTEFWSTSCVPCVNGTFMDVPTGRRQCFPCTSCSGLKNSLCTTTSDTVCEPLEGFYSLRHKRCEPGQYIIHKVVFLSTGKRVKTDCTEYRSTSCLPCVNRTSFMTHSNGLRECFPCASSGLKINSLCTTTSDTVCEPLEGFYCIDRRGSRCVEALRHKRCQPGQYIIHKGTALTDTECSDCSDGTFSNGTSTSCQPHTQCESQNLQLIKPGTVSTDAECGKDYDSTIVVAIVVSFLLICVSLTVIYFFWMKKKGCLFGKI
uniref:TNFR-Cys domain-containing protein n=1 Tax=Scophthalmus maximus TaxID=52904 RepID=A0A8D2ZF35_SCOMX